MLCCAAEMDYGLVALSAEYYGHGFLHYLKNKSFFIVTYHIGFTKDKMLVRYGICVFLYDSKWTENILLKKAFALLCAKDGMPTNMKVVAATWRIFAELNNLLLCSRWNHNLIRGMYCSVFFSFGYCNNNTKRILYSGLVDGSTLL